MRGPRPRALIETDPATGDLRIHLRGVDLGGPAPRVTVDGYTGTPHPDNPPVTEGQWAHLKRACAQRSGTAVFEPAEVQGRALEVRESAALALAHHGFATMWTVRVGCNSAGWAIVPTEEGRAALRAHLGAASVPLGQSGAEGPLGR